MPELASLAVVALLAITPLAEAPAPREQASPLRAALAAGPAFAAAPSRSVAASVPRDSLRNGAIIGSIAGGVLGMMAGAVGCGAGSILSGEGADCTSATFVGAIGGAALGGLIGIGIDAMFERAPSAAGVPEGRRRGVRLHVRF